MKTYTLALGCTDATTGKTGCFLFHSDFKACTPIFDDAIKCFQYMKVNGFTEVDPYSLTTKYVKGDK